jgi:hypothetical protein
MKLLRRNTRGTEFNHIVLPTDQEHLEFSSEQPVSSPPTLFNAWVREKNPELIKSEFQMTIRNKVTTMTTKQASMLMKILSVQALFRGIDLSMYMAMEHLRNLLTKNSTLSIETIKDEKDRRALLLSELILLNVRGEWQSFEERLWLPTPVIEEIKATGWLPDKRTYNSWKVYWEPSKFLEFRIVPLEDLLDRSGYSSPYSGYCKGYGEGGHSSRIQKTRYSSELDGSEYVDTVPPRINLLEVTSYQRILLAIEAERARKVQTIPRDS